MPVPLVAAAASADSAGPTRDPSCFSDFVIDCSIMPWHILVSGARFELRLLKKLCHEAGLDWFTEVKTEIQISESEAAARIFSPLATLLPFSALFTY